MMRQVLITIKDIQEKQSFYIIAVASGEDRSFISITKLHNELCYVVNVNEGYTITTTYYPLKRFEIEEVSLCE